MFEPLQIVVADDDPVFRYLVQLKLEADGHKVTLACDGDDAHRLVTTAPPDLLVLDVAMPGLDGLEVTRRLREQPQTATLPIVLLTGRDTDPDIKAGRQCGVDYYITKPFVIDQLRYFINTMHDRVEPDAPWDDTID